jgi:hypothetical protein
LKRGSTDDGHFWFEYAALSLLSGDRPASARACAHLVERCGKPGGPRAYHAARACTLAPDALADAPLPGRLAALAKAQSWLDQFREGMPPRAAEDFGLHFHNWLEAHVLRREAEALIQSTGPRSRMDHR